MQKFINIITWNVRPLRLRAWYRRHHVWTLIITALGGVYCYFVIEQIRKQQEQPYFYTWPDVPVGPVEGEDF